MKGAIVLAFLCIFAFSGVTKGQDQNDCQWKCTGPEGSKNYVIKIDVNVYIVFNNDLNFFAIYNAQLNIAIIFDYTNKFLLVLNLQVGAGILINVQTSATIYFKFTAVTTVQTSATIFVTLSTLFALSAQYQAQVTGSVDLTIGVAFNINIVIQGLIQGQTLEAILNGRSELAANLRAGFQVVFSLVVKVVTQFSLNGQVGFLLFFAALLDLNVQIQNSIFKFFDVILQISGEITAAVFIQLQASIQVSAQAVVQLNAALQLVGTVFVNITLALQALAQGAIEGIKTTTIKGVGEITSYVATDKSWVISIAGGVAFRISFSFTNRYIAFINLSTNFALVFSFNSVSRFAVVNIKTGEVLVINLTTIYLITSSATGIITNIKNNQISAAIAIVATVIVSASPSTSAGSINIITGVVSNAQVKAIVQTAFGAVVNISVSGITIVAVLGKVIAGAFDFDLIGFVAAAFSSAVSFGINLSAKLLEILRGSIKASVSAQISIGVSGGAAVAT